MAVTHGQGNPNWTRDETILALNLYFKLNGANPNRNDKRIINLSETLNQLPIHPLSIRKQQFRNPDGVAFKILNLKNVATGNGLQNVSKMDRDVWDEFGDKRELVARIATEIIEDSASFDENEHLNESVPDEESFVEGKIITATHKRKERNPNLRKAVIGMRKKHNKLFCDICGIKPYFDDSIDECAFFECHHIIPLSQVGGLVETKPEDMAFLCANCHKAIHQKIAKEKKWVSPDEMKVLLLRKTSKC